MINLDSVKLDVIYRIMNSETFGLKRVKGSWEVTQG
jgi:hypothetical protein